MIIISLGFQDRICYEKTVILQEKDTLLMQSAFQNMMSSLICDLIANCKNLFTNHYVCVIQVTNLEVKLNNRC